MAAPEDPVVIASFARTPMGGFQGALSPVKATSWAPPRSGPPSTAPASRPTRCR
jgi:hypothetical protein